MSRILDNESLMLRLKDWIDVRIGWVQRHYNYKFSVEEWEDITGGCYRKAWNAIDTIRNHPGDYPATAVGIIKRIVMWECGRLIKFKYADRRDTRKQLSLDDLKPMFDLNRILDGWDDDWNFDNFVDPYDFEQDVLSEGILRRVMVWVGGLDVYEWYTLGIGDAPTNEHMREIRRRIRKHFKSGEEIYETA